MLQLMEIMMQALSMSMKFQVCVNFCSFELCPHTMSLRRTSVNHLIVVAAKIGGASEQATFVQKLIPESPTPSANYGTSVSISSGMIVVGAPADTAVSLALLSRYSAI
jgi:hypothetical protein